MWSFVSLPYRAITEITRLEIDLAPMTHGRRATTGATTVYLFSPLMERLHLHRSSRWISPSSQSFCCSGMNGRPRSKTGSAGHELIKDVCPWYSFSSLRNSPFGSHKAVLHTSWKLRSQKDGMHRLAGWFKDGYQSNCWLHKLEK